VTEFHSDRSKSNLLQIHSSVTGGVTIMPCCGGYFGAKAKKEDDAIPKAGK
jgi:hypothetical protein